MFTEVMVTVFNYYSSITNYHLSCPEKQYMPVLLHKVYY